MKKNDLRLWMWGLVIVLGLAVILYPIVLRAWQKRQQQELIQIYLQGKMPPEELLDGKDMLGVLWIPKVECQLPIFRGTEEHILAAGAGWLEESSELSNESGSENGTHCVLCGHSGLPGIYAFDRIDALEKGDRIYVVSQKQILIYSVTQQLMVLPEEVHLLLQPSQFANEITLLTCTPYGINTHRLLVQAELSRSFGGSAAEKKKADCVETP